MARQSVAIQACLSVGSLFLVSSTIHAQSPMAPAPLPIAMPVPIDEASVQAWTKRLVEQVNETWSESNNEQRQRKLNSIAEGTPAEASFVARALKRPELAIRGATVSAVKDLFSTLRHVNWQPQDAESVQKMTASWMVLVPVLVDSLGDQQGGADYRRQLGRILIDLATMSRDPATGSPNARQLWQAQLPALGSLTRQPKITTRIVALNVIEALVQDAAQAKPAVVDALADSDRFVRWSAVRALQAMGMDQSAMLALATLQHDPDSDVQQAAIAALQATPSGFEILAQQREAPPLKSSPVEESKTTTATLPAKTSATTKATSSSSADTPNSNKRYSSRLANLFTRSSATNETIPSVAAHQPFQADTLRESQAGKPDQPAATASVTKPAATSLDAANSSVPTAKRSFVSSGLTPETFVANSAPIITPKTSPLATLQRAPESFNMEVPEIIPSPAANVASKTNQPELPAQSVGQAFQPDPAVTRSPDHATTGEALAPAKQLISQPEPMLMPERATDIRSTEDKAHQSVIKDRIFMPQNSSLPKAPESLQIENADAIPLWTAPKPPVKNNEPVRPAPMMAPTPPKQQVIQPMSAQVETVKSSSEPKPPLMMDIVKLRSVKVADQIEAVRSLGKLGPKAGDAVPNLAEALVKGEVLVRREVPLALMQIGTPAKLAQSVLERALDDQDTQVRVNAARALLELSDK